MNQPTREEFEQFKAELRAELREEVRKIREQHTEEIKVTRVELASADVLNQLKALEQGQQELREATAALKDNVGALKIEMHGARSDILPIRESQADLRDRLIEHSEDLKVMKEKQDAHSELLGQLINVGEETKNTQDEHTKRFDKIDVTMATKDDISRIEGIMMQILNRLTKAEGE